MNDATVSKKKKEKKFNSLINGDILKIIRKKISFKFRKRKYKNDLKIIREHFY